LILAKYVPFYTGNRVELCQFTADGLPVNYLQESRFKMNQSQAESLAGGGRELILSLWL